MYYASWQKEVLDGSILHEVSQKGGNQESQKDYHEEW